MEVIRLDLHEKLTRVIASAKVLFIVPGYAETKMADIATHANLAVGTLYSLFRSKDDLLKFVFASTLDSMIIDHVQTLPVIPLSDDELVTHTAEIYQQATHQLHKLTTNYSTDARFSAMLDYLFANFHQYGAYFLILERNPQMSPALLKLYKHYRQQLYTDVAQLLATLVAFGKVRYLSHPENDALLIIDQIFWWSAHKQYDSFDHQTNHFDQQQMKNCVIQQLTASYT